MHIIASTDNKYLGKEIPDSTAVGDIIEFGDFIFEVQKINKLFSGNTLFSNTNYQLQCEE